LSRSETYKEKKLQILPGRYWEKSMLSFTIAAPLLALFYYLRKSDQSATVTRWPAVMAMTISLACAVIAAYGTLSGGKPWVEGMLELDALAALPAAVFAGLSLVTLGALPKADQTAAMQQKILAVSAGTMAAYAASDLRLFCAGWALTWLPGLLRRDGEPLAARMLGIISISCLALASFTGAGWPAFLLLALAALIRKGIFPFHFWAPTAFERDSPMVWNLFLNGHLAALLLARFGLKMFPEASKEALAWISVFALLTAIYTALLATRETSSRRLIALLSLSQASFILAGLESRNAEGITGAALHWIVVSVATTGMTIAYRLVEARTPQAAQLKEYLGMSGRVPRIAAFFLISSLALVGLPGTLGFVAEDLLFHGAIESHPLLGLALPLATAINAITILRMFSRIFLGKALSALPQVPDAKPMERLALGACVVVLVVGGLFPQLPIHMRQPAADAVAQLLALGQH
jgi:NADH-quinone oxidoreductase subunit M